MVRRLIESALNRGDYSQLDELLHPDLVEHDAHQAAAASPAEAFIAAVEAFREAFGEKSTTVEDQVAEGAWSRRGGG